MTTHPTSTLVRLAQLNHRALSVKDRKGKTPVMYTTMAKEKEFDKARRSYNLRMAYCPVCVRDKVKEKKSDGARDEEVCA
jgi:hypothetical protein